MIGSDQPVDTIAGQRFVRTEEVSCPLCGNHYESQLIEAQFGMKAFVAVCSPCRIAFQTPRPSPEATLAYMNWRWSSADEYVADSASQIRRAKEQLKLIQSSGVQETRLLDFGAGAGSFVRAALDDGWHAVGVERSDTARNKARQTYGVDLLEELPQESYDVITLWDVVEHLRAPQQMLATLRNHLAPGGTIFVETGNWECWRRVVNKEKWHVYLFDHHFYFSPSSLSKVLTNAGFADPKLLDVNRANPPAPRELLKMPRYGAQCWAAWAKAQLLWPAHGNIDTLVMTGNG